MPSAPAASYNPVLKKQRASAHGGADWQSSTMLDGQSQREDSIPAGGDSSAARTPASCSSANEAQLGAAVETEAAFALSAAASIMSSQSGIAAGHPLSRTSGVYGAAVLEAQYRDSSRLPDSKAQSAADAQQQAVKAGHQRNTLEWKAALSPPQSHLSRQPKELDLGLIQQCTSSWALEPHLHSLVTDYNRRGNAELLIEFTHRRNDFLRHLLAHLNDFWAVITGMAKALLVERMHQMSSGQAKASVDFVLRSKASFRDVHENKIITLWTFQEHRETITLTSLPLADFWLKSASRRTCAAIVFDPRAYSAASSNTTVSNFNLWREFRIAQSVASAAGAGINAAQLESAIQPFLDHVRNIWCRDDADAYAYCMNWMASLVQRPWLKLGVAIVLQGQPGSGKGIIVTEILAKIVGPHHFSHVTGLDQVCGQFNAPALATACLVFVDEAMCSGNKRHAAKLKMLITESQHTVENKYVQALSVESFANYILSSNEDHVVAIEHKDRRYFALQTDNRFSGSQTAERKAYFDQLLAVPVELVKPPELLDSKSRPHASCLFAGLSHSQIPVANVLCMPVWVTSRNLLAQAAGDHPVSNHTEAIDNLGQQECADGSVPDLGGMQGRLQRAHGGSEVGVRQRSR